MGLNIIWHAGFGTCPFEVHINLNTWTSQVDKTVTSHLVTEFYIVSHSFGHQEPSTTSLLDAQHNPESQIQFS